MSTIEPIQRVLRRVDLEREDSDISLFHALLYLGEAILKTVVLSAVACVDDDEQRYRQAHALVRADGLGVWTDVLFEVSQGPASSSLVGEARTERRELTQRVGASESLWQHEAVSRLRDVLATLDPAVDPLADKVTGLSWFNHFVQLRNKTRGHGAPPAEFCASACPELERSMRCVIDQYALFHRPWAYLHQNLSGRYRVTPLGGRGDAFAALKSGNPPTFPDGVYIHYGRPVLVQGLSSSVDADDFFYWNGGFTPATHEFISYATGETIKKDSAPFQKAAFGLPRSETAARELDVVGRCLSNVPPAPTDYVPRLDLEAALDAELMNEHHLVVTLVGRGGIGKTFLALSTLHQIVMRDRFSSVIWFSARDIDLMPEGPKQVHPDVQTEREMAKQLVELAEPSAAAEKGFVALEFFSESLELGLPVFDQPPEPTLFVFDNFETVRLAVDVYNWIDNNVRAPNKVLITTRFRDFRGDYPVEVLGMSREECDELVRVSAARLGIRDYVTDDLMQELYEESDGHPYVVKVLLGEAARSDKPGRVKRVVAAREDMLDALFERTYATLSRAAQRIFLTLSSWRSIVPELALEAVLLRPANERMDVGRAVEELQTSSLIDVWTSPEDSTRFLSVPLVGSTFGKRKLTGNPHRSGIEADVALLQSFGPAKVGDVRHGITPRLSRFFSDVAKMVNDDPARLDDYVPMLELVARQHPRSWLLLSQFYEEQGGAHLETAKEACRRFIEQAPRDSEGWGRLVDLCRRSDDGLAELHARVEWAELGDAAVDVASEACQRFNALLHDGRITLGADERKAFGHRMLRIMSSRREELDATDCSRAAWTAMNLKDVATARRFTKRGLEIDPDHPHCKRLAEKLFAGE